ncbi:response regulator transcription factor [Chitinophaga barathri]|uniref:DNA-binding response regulator n=1 Tax=Chitinophaga barathri TaxID=1647451 RepID=A0A3N4MLM3_9BACT|nr:response regulator transcription factor [Chitinophaga barathri]RPD42966.1 DNA-binding response regulator [Chitinophaga barathri]
MESLKVIIVRDNKGNPLLAKKFSVEEFIKGCVFQYENWKISRPQALKAHLIIICPELELYQAKHAVKKIRERSDVIPIIAIRLENSIVYKAPLFDAGLDDYLCMPFDGRELTYRVDALIRRTIPLNSDMPETFQIADSLLDYSRLTIRFNADKAFRLTQRQADLLCFFCKHPDVLLKRGEILTHVWGKDDYFLGRSMDVIITGIRKILSASPVIRLETIHGKGFIFHTNKK